MDAEWVIAACTFAGLLGTLGLSVDRWLHKPDDLRRDFAARAHVTDERHARLQRDVRQLDKDIGQVRHRMDTAHQRYGDRDRDVLNKIILLEIKIARLEERTEK